MTGRALFAYGTDRLEFDKGAGVLDGGVALADSVSGQLLAAPHDRTAPREPLAQLSATPGRSPRTTAVPAVGSPAQTRLSA